MTEPKTIPVGKTHLDRQRETFTIALAKRIHKYIKPHPDAFDEDDIIVEREGWITEDEMKAIAYSVKRDLGADDYECFVEAAKRNMV